MNHLHALWRVDVELISETFLLMTEANSVDALSGHFLTLSGNNEPTKQWHSFIFFFHSLLGKMCVRGGDVCVPRRETEVDSPFLPFGRRRWVGPDIGEEEGSSDKHPPF
jgi:hypothetical protein